MLHIQKKLKLHTLSLEQLEGIIRFCIVEGNVDPTRLRTALLSFLPDLESSSKGMLHRIVSDIVDLFDANDNGVLDIPELCAALSILWQSSEYEKVYLIFKVLDNDGDGNLKYDEMERYLIAFFKACFHFSGKEVSNIVGTLSPEQVADAMMCKCFEDLNIQRDDTINFEAFAQWYSSVQL
mmetsp:Transcript_8702/g.16048  ORF Transcript_8702/g.16048 Transcript_8702/m.16048 type:complete len:181 (+) Transcript_8702:149-691(+)